MPYDYNASERAIRNIKIKSKKSTQFRTIKSAVQFATIRLLMDTATKNVQNIFNALNTIVDYTQ